MALPDWIIPIEGKINHFAIDPDIYYPQVLAELGVEKPNQYWLEVAQGCMKLDFNMHVAMSGMKVPGRSVTRYIRADDGRKQRWNLTMHSKGKVPKLAEVPSAHGVEWDSLSIQDRSRHIRYHYKRIRGFIPSG